jgi:hypothetical protein
VWAADLMKPRMDRGLGSGPRGGTGAAGGVDRGHPVPLYRGAARLFIEGQAACDAGGSIQLSHRVSKGREGGRGADYRCQKTKRSCEPPHHTHTNHAWTWVCTWVCTHAPTPAHTNHLDAGASAVLKANTSYA